MPLFWAPINPVTHLNQELRDFSFNFCQPIVSEGLKIRNFRV